MNLEKIKVAVAAVWILGVLAVGLVVGASSSFWLVLVALAIVPPFVMMRYWKGPDETISQSIQQILR